ncbi:site-specific integrase [Desulfosarcina cetonica]
MRTYNPNQNHPQKGRRITVAPIRRLKDIQAIKKMLESTPRDYLLFVLGINNGLRVGDLLTLTVGDLRHLKPGEEIAIIEGKTGKRNILMVNKATHKALRAYLAATDPDDADPLFPSRKTGRPITIQAVNALVKKWAHAINLKGNYGAHTLRKTFGYIQRVEFAVGFEVLSKRYNHASPAVTMRYLGITDKEVNRVLLNEI